jgi:hypothetical protein
MLAGTLIFAASAAVLLEQHATHVVSLSRTSAVGQATICRRIEGAWYNYLPLTYLVRDWGMSQYRCGSPATQVVSLPRTNQVAQTATCRTMGTGLVTYVPLTYLVKEWGTSQSDCGLDEN